MSQVDNRSSSAAKRARTDGSRREDDWTCLSCGNVNFSFRTTCNKKNCTQSRPADYYSKSAAKSMQGYTASSPLPGPAVPPSMYFGIPPYSPYLFNGGHLPPYDAPFSGRSGYHYNYGSRLANGSLYRPSTLSAPSPFYGGSMMGGMYGIPPIVDRYGMGMPLPHSAMGPRPVFFPDDTPQQKDSTREDDWTCPKCGNVNFSFRAVCNMRKCNTERPGSMPAKPDKSSKQQMPNGSWKCEKCNNINYPFREKCNRQNCGADKPLDSNRSASPAAEENDQ